MVGFGEENAVTLQSEKSNKGVSSNPIVRSMLW